MSRIQTYLTIITAIYIPIYMSGIMLTVTNIECRNITNENSLDIQDWNIIECLSQLIFLIVTWIFICIARDLGIDFPKLLLKMNYIFASFRIIWDIFGVIILSKTPSICSKYFFYYSIFLVVLGIFSSIMILVIIRRKKYHDNF